MILFHHQWQPIGGRLKWISSGENIVVGVNSNNDIFNRQGISQSNPFGTDWVQISGQLVNIDIFQNGLYGTSDNMHAYQTAYQQPEGTGF